MLQEQKSENKLQNVLHNFPTGSGSHHTTVTPITRRVSMAGDQGCCTVVLFSGRLSSQRWKRGTFRTHSRSCWIFPTLFLAEEIKVQQPRNHSVRNRVSHLIWATDWWVTLEKLENPFLARVFSQCHQSYLHGYLVLYIWGGMQKWKDTKLLLKCSTFKVLPHGGDKKSDG